VLKPVISADLHWTDEDYARVKKILARQKHWEALAAGTMGMLAAYLVLPKRTREAFGEALDDMVDAADAVLAAAAERILGGEPARLPGLLTQDLHKALSTLRERSKPLDNPLPWRRGRSSYQRTLRVLTAVDHFSSAEDVLDAAEAYAVRIPDPDRRAALLSATRLLRRIDQVVVKFATDLGHAGEARQPQNLPATA